MTNNLMKNANYLILLVMLVMVACQQEEEESIYSGNSKSYDLFQSSDFEYKGFATFRELKSGEVEIEIDLQGPRSEEAYFFTGHLHFGPYDAESADVAYLLSPVDIRTLNSKTVLGQLSNGESLSFEAIGAFNGHIKIHLADEGPDYAIILASGNIGSNPNSIEGFDADKITLCTPYFPAN
jgi:hypothetical protein